jgi:REP element-mobilizing transposase RayT
MSGKHKSDNTDVGFEPLDPWRSTELNRRDRNLPHLEVPGATYFITFRCLPEKRLSEKAKDLVMAGILSLDGQSISLDATVVMDDHVHLVFRLTGTLPLSKVLQRVKGGSARKINQMLGSKGSIWMDESFDHVIRNDADLEDKLEYIRQNPVTKGLVHMSSDYRWLYLRDEPA